MKHKVAIFGTVLVLIAPGCVSRPPDYVRGEDVPTSTPWHTNDVAYSVYQLGYVSGYDDFMARHAKQKGRMMAAPSQAERDGYLAGVAAAYDAWDNHWQEYWLTNWNGYFHKGQSPDPIAPVK
jgi:hypothetical protein